MGLLNSIGVIKVYNKKGLVEIWKKGWLNS